MTDNLKTRIAEAVSKHKYVNEIVDAVLDVVEPMMSKWMPIEGRGWFISINEHWNQPMEDSFRDMMNTVKHGGQIDVFARIDGKDYRWQCDGLQYAKFTDYLPTPPEKE